MTDSTPREPGNPFIAQRIRPGAIPYLFAGVSSAEQLIAELQRNAWQGAILGPHGSGKSTLLASLRAPLEAVGRHVIWIELHDGERRLPAQFAATPLDASSQIVVDGYEQLSWRSRWKLRGRAARAACGLLVTSHTATRLPVLWTTQTDSALAVAVVRALEARQPGAVPLPAGEIERAYALHQGNVREMLFTLYDVYRRGTQARPDK